VVATTDTTKPPAAFATFHSAYKHKNKPAYERVNGLGFIIADWIEGIIAANIKEQDVRLVIEKPIYNANPENFALQWRLFQSILAWVCSDMPNISILEVNPKTVKLIGAGKGNATKEDMVAASFFAGEDTMNVTDREALADAEAIAKCAKIMPPPGELYRGNNANIAADHALTGTFGGFDA